LKSESQIAADLLEQVLSGSLAADEAERGWPKNESDDRSLHAALHALGHYRVDADIRAKDERYSEWQTDQLRQIAGDLASDSEVDPAILDALEPRPGCLFGMLARRKR
jgi:hypothetical protein